MKNITAQYRDLQEGKMTKANFMANVRMQFPDYISPVTSYEDMVNILKSKRILSETHEQKTFYLVDDRGQVADSVQATDKTAAENHFYNEFEGQMTGWMVTDVHPDSLDENAKDIEALQAGALKEDNAYQMGLDANERGDNHDKCPYKKGTPDADLWMDGWMDYETAKQIEHDEETYNRETGGYGDLYNDKDKDDWSKMDKDDVHPGGFPGMTERLNEAVDSITVLRDLYYFDKLNTLAAKEDVDAKYHNYGTLWAKKGDTFDTDSEESNMIMNSSRLEKGKDYTTGQMKESLNEAVEKPEGSYKKVTGKDLYSFFNEIDRVNPYEVRKGIAIEMGMQYEATPNYFTDKFNPESLAKATKKVLKNLQKDPAYYTNMISLPTEKRTNMLQKPAEVKVKSDGQTKIKGFTDAKSNTETNLSKRERAKGSPEGVKEMKPSKKSMGGLKTMKSNDKLPKGVELMKEADLTKSPAGLNTLKTSDLAAAGKAIHDLLGKTFTVSALPTDKIKGYEDLKVGDKLKITKHWRNANNALLFGTDKSEYGLTQQDIKSLTMPNEASRLKELVMQEVKRRMSEGGLYALKNPANPAAKGLPSVVSPDPSTETSTAFKNMYIKKAQ